MGEKGILDELLSAPINTTSDLRLSFSRVSSFIQNGPSVLQERKKISNDGIKMGKLIDLLLFERIKFNDEYYVGSTKKPTGHAGILIDKILESYTTEFIKESIIEDGNDFTVSYEFATRVTETAEGLWSNVKDLNKRQSKMFATDNINYLSEHVNNIDKTELTVAELDMAEKTVSALKTHKHTKHLFEEGNIGSYYQFEVEFEYNDFNFLAYLDIVQVDHKNKTICIKDLKTGRKNENYFLSSVLSFNYYLQAKLYQIAAKKVMEMLKVEDYTLQPFEFVYISRFDNIPAIYSVSEKWEKAATTGFKTTRGSYYPGLDESLEEIRWHWNNKVFDCSKLTYESNGQKKLEDNFIETVNE